MQQSLPGVSQQPLQKAHQTFLQLATQRNMPKRDSVGSEHRETVLPEETQVDDDVDGGNSFELQSSSKSKRKGFYDSVVPTERHLILKTKQSMEKPTITDFGANQCKLTDIV